LKCSVTIAEENTDCPAAYSEVQFSVTVEITYANGLRTTAHNHAGPLLERPIAFSKINVNRVTAANRSSKIQIAIAIEVSKGSIVWSKNWRANGRNKAGEISILQALDYGSKFSSFQTKHQGRQVNGPAKPRRGRSLIQAGSLRKIS
jgi:hypothetical protein